MAGVDVAGGARGKRSMNADINMIPFIDLLMVTVAFLLITAVWVTNAQIKANANVPGPPLSSPPRASDEKVLDVSMESDRFVVAWRLGKDVVATRELARPTTGGAYDELARVIEADWKMHGSHVSAADPARDVAVLHTDNATPFKEVVAAMDAIHATQRERVVDEYGKTERVSAFEMTFASR